MRKRKVKNNIPALVMLSAGAIYCVRAFLCKIQGMTFLTHLLCVLLGFYVIGIILLVIVEIKFPEKPEGGDDENSEAESTEGQEEEKNSEEQKSSEVNEEETHQQEEETIYM